MIDGKQDRMVGKIQERYGIAKEKAEGANPRPELPSPQGERGQAEGELA
jgi:hypothetical protein